MNILIWCMTNLTIFHNIRGGPENRIILEVYTPVYDEVGRRYKLLKMILFGVHLGRCKIVLFFLVEFVIYEVRKYDDDE